MRAGATRSAWAAHTDSFHASLAPAPHADQAVALSLMEEAFGSQVGHGKVRDQFSPTLYGCEIGGRVGHVG